MSRQSIRDYETARQALGIPSQVGVDDYMAVKEDINSILEGANSPLSGTGSPEGVVTSNLSKMYVDTATGDLYFNPAFEASTGWIAIS